MANTTTNQFFPSLVSLLVLLSHTIGVKAIDQYYSATVVDFTNHVTFDSSPNVLHALEVGLLLAAPNEEARARSFAIPFTELQKGDFVVVAPEITWNSAINSYVRFSIEFQHANGEWTDEIPATRCYQNVKPETTWLGTLINAPSDAVAYRYRIAFGQNGVHNPVQIQGLKLHIISLSNLLDPATQPTTRDHRVRIAACDSIPRFLSRDSWDAPTANPQGTAQCNNLLFAPISHAVIHHSATSNESPNWGAMVLALWHFDTRVLGRCDIGYNWLIDPDGRIYEGHAGGYEVVGDHLGCLSSSGSLGICMLGTYRNQAPSPSAMASLRELLEWQVCNSEMSTSSQAIFSVANQDLPRLFTPEAVCEKACTPNFLTDLLPDLWMILPIEDLLPEGAVTIFPNPSAGQFNLLLHVDRAQTAEVAVRDMGGRLVHTKAWRLTIGENRLSLSLRHLPASLYLVQVQTEQGQLTQRAIIGR